MLRNHARSQDGVGEQLKHLCFLLRACTNRR